jgi:hypothetical protein
MNLKYWTVQFDTVTGPASPAPPRRSAMRAVVINHVTLDGVMQVPGRPGEDARDRFTHVGWNGAVSA